MKIRSLKQTLTRRFVADIKGSTAATMAILAPVVVFGLALGTEAGMWEMEKRRLQNAADTAVFAAGTQLRSGLSENEMREAAVLMAVNSGYPLKRHDDTNTARIAAAEGTLTLNSPPTISPYASSTNPPPESYVHVLLETNVSRRFSKLFRSGDVPVRADAVALIQNGRPACVLALHPTSTAAVEVSGSADLTLTGCDVAANSISSSAFEQSGNAQLETTCVSVVGGATGDIGDSATYDVHLTDPECTEAKENAPITPDPYANRTFPVDPTTLSCETGADRNRWKQNNGKPPSGKKYCNGENITNATVEINVDATNPWVVLHNGSWKINSNSTFIAEGVTLYLTGTAELDISGGADVRIKAPSTGDSAGMAIWIDASNTATLHRFNGGSGWEIVGAIYGPNADLDMRGNTESTAAGECTQVIGAKVSFGGNVSMDTDCSNSGTETIKVAETIQIVE